MTAWSLERAEEHLLSLELFGMRFGLERMRRLLTVLGSPQEAFRAVHVVGTNGKSSTVRMTAGVLAAHGVRTGAFLSPHLTTFAERVRVGGRDLAPDAFAAAVQRAAAAAAKVDRTLDEGDRVTQFELVTATAFAEFARARVEVAVVEAGLGGRWDATNVLGAPVVVLTNVGLEHTRWLGPTLTDIAQEKLAVLPRGATLVTGELEPEAEAVAARVAAEQGARRVRVGAAAAAPAAGTAGLVATAPPAGAAAALPGYQRENFAVAVAAAEALHGPLDPARVVAAAAHAQVPGRLQVVAGDPLTVLDGAHNPSGMRALVRALPDAVGERPLVAVLSVLDDKDATEMLRALAPRCRALVLTRTANPRALPAATLASLAGQLGHRDAHIVPDPRRALARARELAGTDGAVIATGSIYLVADLLSAPGRRRASAL